MEVTEVGGLRLTYLQTTGPLQPRFAKMILPRFCGHCFSSCHLCLRPALIPGRGGTNIDAHHCPRIDDRHRVDAMARAAAWLAVVSSVVWCSNSRGLRYPKLEWRRRGL